MKTPLTHAELQERARKSREAINAALGAKPNDPEAERIFVEECEARSVRVVRMPAIDVGDAEHNIRVTDGKFEPADMALVSAAALATRARFGLPATTNYRRVQRTGSPPAWPTHRPVPK